MYKNYEFNELIKINNDFINSKVYKSIDFSIIKKIVNILNTDKKIIISGIDFVGKIDVVKTILKKTKYLENSVYFNKRLDFENIIKNGNKLKSFINESVNKDTKIIILHNIGEIENIKDFLKYLLKTDYKIIIVGNDIKVNFIKDIEIKQSFSDNIENDLYYGNLGFLSKSTSSNLIKINVSLIKDKIILDNIFDLKSVKDINLYNSTISFLSKYDGFYSIREMYNDFLRNENIAIKTFTDYIYYTEQSKIIEKVPLYDLNYNKKIKTKNRYFFLDNGILNSLNYFRQKKDLLIKNLVFIKLYYYNFYIFGGRTGNYEFDFYIKSDEKSIFAIKISSEENLKKDLSRMKKIKAEKKYIILENLEEVNIRKKVYDNLEIISLEDFIKKDLTFNVKKYIMKT